MRMLVSMIVLIGGASAVVALGPGDADGPAAKPTGPLTAVETELQGIWRTAYTVVIDGRDFCADTQPGEWYEGYIVVREDARPPQLDFVIEDCGNCGFKGMASEGIFQRVDGSIVSSSPTPGHPRPTDFDQRDMVRLRFARGGTSKFPATHCLNESGEADGEDTESEAEDPPLTPEEEKIQGVWRGGYTIVVTGREFCADTQPGEWYEGPIIIRPDEEPAQMDFVIRVQSGQENGNTSEGIYHWKGETLVVVAPTPGGPRPTDFEFVPDGSRVKLRLSRDGKAQYPASHCLGE